MDVWVPRADSKYSKFLDQMVPRHDAERAPLTGRAQTLAEQKRTRLSDLYRLDPRAAPWVGTAFGVLQAFNTYEHHDATVRSTSRADRNQLRTVTGAFGQLDRATWRTLSAVLERP
jgi:hypothetical protein